MTHRVAGIDVHKKVLMVVVVEVESDSQEWRTQRRRCATTTAELQRLAGWLREQGVEEAVMESTAQYWPDSNALAPWREPFAASATTLSSALFQQTRD